MFLNIHCSLKKIAAEVDTLRRHKPVAKLCDDATDRQSVAGLARDIEPKRLPPKENNPHERDVFVRMRTPPPKLSPTLLGGVAQRRRSQESLRGALTF